jgi:hypothetical protein
MECIKKFCSDYGFKQVEIIAKDRFVKSVSSKEWFAIEILDDKVRLSYENYNLNTPIIKDYNFAIEYVKYLMDLNKLNDFIKNKGWLK